MVAKSEGTNKKWYGGVFSTCAFLGCDGENSASIVCGSEEEGIQK